MSRVAKNPVFIPSGVDISFSHSEVKVKGKNGELNYQLSNLVEPSEQEIDGKKCYQFIPKSNSKQARAMAGTTRALFNNSIIGVSDGFERRLQLEGVGYRAQAKGSILNLTLGFSHPINYELPPGVVAETPSQTEVVLKSSDKQQLGQVASEIRKLRAPEPYKGKGIRYQGERIRRKETKKK